MLFDLQSLIILLPVILIVITIHEYSHAKAADMLGDITPRLAGRLTLNPISHIDPIGFLALLLFRFGWAKPVPINPYNFKDPQKGEMYVSLAGPMSNFFCAWLGGLALKYIPFPSADWTFIPVNFLGYFVWISLALGVFNLIPVPPLDGSKILASILPPEYSHILDSLNQYGFFILIFILLFPGTNVLLFSLIEFFYRLFT